MGLASLRHYCAVICEGGQGSPIRRLAPDSAVGDARRRGRGLPRSPKRKTSSSAHESHRLAQGTRQPASQPVGSGSGVTTVVDFTRFVSAPSGPVVVLVAVDSSGLL